MYRSLDFSKIAKTIESLCFRIEERFPGSNIKNVCFELKVIADETQSNLDWISKPHLVLRGVVGSFIAVCIFLIVYSVSSFDFPRHSIGIIELVQVIETIVNEIIFIGAALFFLVSLEAKYKRSKALSSINELRAMAHVIDMHQLTKDPTEITQNNRTASSPKRTMSIYELSRYYDYCSEMLSLIAKISALYAQRFPESEVVSAVNEVESLTNGLSRKIWQKMMVLQESKVDSGK